MEFTFRGSMEDLKDAIRRKARRLHKDILIEDGEPGVLKIGFQRHGHSNGGRFFVANVTQESGTLRLSGEIQDVFPDDHRSEVSKWLTEVGNWLFAYLFLLAIPLVLWLIFFGSRHIWIPLLAPVPVLIGLRLNAKKSNRELDARADADFIRFMTHLTEKTDCAPKSNWQLLRMLEETDGLHSLPEVREEFLMWELYENATVTATIDSWDTLIRIDCRQRNEEISCSWHPDDADIYEELCALGKKGSILVLRKRFGEVHVFHKGRPEEYRFSPGKKRHFGKLYYCKQK